VRRHSFFFFIILIVAAVLRLRGLVVQSLWFDELITLCHSRPDLPLGNLISICRDMEAAPPFFYLLLWVWQHLFGVSEFTVRLLPALLGIGGVAAIYFLGKELFSRETGLAAMAITTVTPFHLYYSQEARPYSLIFLATVLSFLFLVRALKSSRMPDKVLYAGVTLVLLWSHYFGMFVCAAQLIFVMTALLFKNDFARAHQRDLKQILGWCLWCVLLFCLLWSAALLRMGAMNSFWTTKPIWYFFVDYFQGYWGDSLWLSLVLFFLMVFYLVFDNKKHEFVLHKPLLLSWVITVLAIPYLRSFNHPSVLVPRYTIVILPALILMIAKGLTRIEKTVWRYSILIGIVALLFLNIFWAHGNYYTRVTKTQWREAAAFVMTKDPQGRYPIYVFGGMGDGLMPAFRARCYGYYFNDIFKRSVKVVPLKRDAVIFQEGQRQISGFWLLESEFLMEHRGVFLKKGFRVKHQLFGFNVVATLFVLEQN
ncbi:MAG TPA: glycosyltransferase family 39 protein, partial [Candidatus Bathyarchaeia archaeon]|nr:glycosyltransferase family 39 protein [Candidatus Bathyarchaeia archaeon]